MIILQIFKYIFENIEKRKINYLLSGSYALNLYTPPRGTRDIDIVIDLGPSNLDSFFEIFSEGFYLNKEAIREDIKQKRIFNIIHNETFFKFDFIPKKQDEYSNEQFHRKKYLKIDGFHAWALTAEDLIISKLQWSQQSKSALQMSDLKELLEKENLDKEYLMFWTKKLNLNTFNLF